MDKQAQVKRRVAEIVARFEQDMMSIHPRSVSVDLHPNLVVVTLHGATSLAEKDYARDRPGRELLERFHTEVFDAVKDELQVLVEHVLGRKVQRCRLNLDPESGDGVILITVADEGGE